MKLPVRFENKNYVTCSSKMTPSKDDPSVGPRRSCSFKLWSWCWKGTIEDYSGLPVKMHHMMQDKPGVCGLVWLLRWYLDNFACRFKLSNFRAVGFNLLWILCQLSVDISETWERSLFVFMEQDDRNMPWCKQWCSVLLNMFTLTVADCKRL